jgi:glycosyltransferase involved in cell wall biosynthesis
LYPLLFDGEIGVSPAITATLNRRPLAKLLKRRSQCIYNAIDIHRFQFNNIDRATKRASLNIPIDVPLIGTVGRLTEQKGFTHFIDAATLVLRRIPQANFIIIGDGELAEQLRNQAQASGISHQVKFTGSRTDVDEILPCLDLFVSASLWEGLPTVIMESMAAGVPIVATNIPGTRELIRPQETGWLVSPGDAVSLAQTILTALDDKRSRQEFTIHALTVVQSFSIESIAAEHVRMYTSFGPTDEQ